MDLEDARLDADFLVPFYEHNAPYKPYVRACVSARVKCLQPISIYYNGNKSFIEFRRMLDYAVCVTRRLLIALIDQFR